MNLAGQATGPLDLLFFTLRVNVESTRLSTYKYRGRQTSASAPIIDPTNGQVGSPAAHISVAHEGIANIGRNSPKGKNLNSRGCNPR